MPEESPEDFGFTEVATEPLPEDFGFKPVEKAEDFGFVETPESRTARKTALQTELKSVQRQGKALDALQSVAELGEFTAEALARPVSGVVGKALDVVVPGPAFVEQALAAPLAPMGRIPEAETVPGKVMAGAGNAVLEFIEGFSSPDMLLQLPAGASKTVLAGWAATMAAHAPEKLIEANQYRKEGKIQEAAQAAVTGIGLGAMAVGVGRQINKAPKATEGQLLREQQAKELAPKTTEMVKEEVGVVQEVKPVIERIEAPVETAVEPPKIEGFTPESLVTPAENVTGFTASVIPKHFVRDLRSKVIEWGKIGGHLPEDVLEVQRVMEGKIGAEDWQVKATSKDFNDALQDVYKLSNVRMMGGGSKLIPAADVVAMDRYLKGEVPASAIPEKLRAPLDNMRAEINGLSNQVLERISNRLDAMDPNTEAAQNLASLYERIKENQDVYLSRSYKYFDSTKNAPQWYEDLSPKVRADAEAYLKSSTPGKTMTDVEARTTLLRWLSDLKDPAGGKKGTGGALGAKDLSLFMTRKKIPQELRDVLGQYNNPLVNYARTVTKQAQWIAKEDFLQEVKARGMGKFLFEEGTEPPGFNTRIAAEASESMNPLNGLRTSPEIAEAFKQMDASYNPSFWWRGLMTLNAGTKMAATVQSLMTQIRNLTGRPIMAGMAGHLRLDGAADALKAVYRTATDNVDWRDSVKRYAELKVIGDTSRAKELQKILQDAGLNDVAAADLNSWSLWKFSRRIAYDIPGEVYKLMDELGNIYGFEVEKAVQKRIHPDWKPEQIEQAAAKYVREVYPNYSEAPKFVQEFRKQPFVGPFVNFGFQVYRNMWNGIGHSLGEIRSKNPTEQKIGWQRLFSQLSSLTLSYALYEASKRALNISDEEENDFRFFQPDYAKYGRFLFTGKDDDGKLSAINASYTDPYSYATDLTTVIMNGVQTGRDPFDIFVDATKQIFSPWMSESMLQTAVREAINGETDFGKPIFNKTDSEYDKFQKRVRHVMNTLLPGTLQRVKRRIIPAALNEQPASGKELDLATEIARELSGVSVEKFDFKTGLRYKGRAFVKDEDEAEMVFRSQIGGQKTLTDDDAVEAYAEANRRRFKVWQDLRKAYLAAVRRGVDPGEARRILVNESKLSAQTARSIVAGIYRPLAITDAMKDSAKRVKRTIPIERINAEKEKFNERPLDSTVNIDQPK